MRYDEHFGHKMIESLEIDNYRCFKRVSLNGIKRMNIIVGDSGSGKTALCEALFITGGVSPEIFLRTKSWRGVGETQVSLEREGYEGLWKELFHALDPNAPVAARFVDSSSGERSVRIFYGDSPSASVTLPFSSATTSAEAAEIRPITFEWTTPDGRKHPLTVEVSSEGLKIPRFAESYPFIFMGIATVTNSTENAKRFSELSKRRHQADVTSAVNAMFPQITDLSVESNGASLAIFASVDGLDEKLPLGSISGGLNKYVSILIALATKEKGAVIVDELENGIYYKKLPGVWSSMLQICRKKETQLFVTSHSQECIEAALPEIEQHPDAFSLIRVERSNNKSMLRIFSGKDLRSAIEQGVEYR